MEMNDSQAKAYYEQLQELDERTKQLHHQSQIADSKISELNELVKNIDEFGRIEVGSEILVPIGSGIFVKATLTDNSVFRVNVGSEVVVDKNGEQTKDMMLAQQKEIMKYKDMLIQNIKIMDQQSLNIEKELQGKFGAEGLQ